MDSFETLIADMLQHEGYWTLIGYKIPLTKADKVAIGKASHPRGEIDILAYKPRANELLAIECKSFLDSTGVKYTTKGFDPPKMYKMFTDSKKREVVLNRLVADLVERGFCLPDPKVVMSLAAGHFRSNADRKRLVDDFEARGWRLFGPDWIVGKLETISKQSYQDDVASVVSKLLLRGDRKL